MVSIPAAAIVTVVPNVISAGGSGLDLVGLILTNSAQLPIGTVQRFSTAADVSTYFGALSAEAGLASVYFAGYDDSSIKPAALLLSRYATAAVAPFLRTGNLSGLTLTQLQALTGVLTITVSGSAKTSSTINLSAATSFSNAASIIQAAFTSPGFTVSYDTVSGGFVFLNTATGAASTLTYATGSLAIGLKATAATGAALSQGSDVMVPGTAMDGVVAQTQNFVSFMTTFKPSDADMLLFASWANGKSNRYLYVGHDNNTAATTSGDTTSVGPLVRAANYSATALVYDPTNGPTLAAFVLGAIASINFAATNGRTTLAFRTGSITAGVTNQSVADNLAANGYNFVGAYGTANDQFTFLYPGQVSGPFAWIDSWANQVWMNNGFQLALMNLLTSIGSIPYNADGYGLIEAGMMDQVNAAINFGAVRPGVTLSGVQAAQIDNAAGVKVSDTIQQRGWYIQVQPATAQVRAARGSPPLFFWYTDGQSVHKLTLSSALVQ